MSLSLETYVDAEKQYLAERVVEDKLGGGHIFELGLEGFTNTEGCGRMTV